MIAHVHLCSYFLGELLMVSHSSVYFGFLYQLNPTLRFRKVSHKGEDDVTINILDVKSNHVYVLVHCMVGLIIL